MDTQLIALTLIALIGFGVMLISFNSEVTGQGIKMVSKETLQKVAEQNNHPTEDFPGMFTLNECIIISQIYQLRKELNLKTNTLEGAKTLCENIKGVKF